jgi:REP element-mobilizing transposase RayT
MYGKVREDVREILKTLCGYKKAEIIAGNVRQDHVHLCVCVPPKLSVSDFVGYLKCEPQSKTTIPSKAKQPFPAKQNRDFVRISQQIS